MTTLQAINFIATYAIKHPNYQTVVIGSNFDMTILEAIADLSLNAPNIEWHFNTTDCENTILIY
jgi:hypothetical protein